MLTSGPSDRPHGTLGLSEAHPRGACLPCLFSPWVRDTHRASQTASPINLQHSPAQTPAQELEKVAAAMLAGALDVYTGSKSSSTLETPARLWLDAGGLFIALGRPARNFLPAMPKAEREELSLKCAQENQPISCVFTHCTPRLVTPGKNPSRFYQV